MNRAELHIALICVGCTGTPEPSAAPPDVLLVVLDTVRADRLSVSGHPRPNSPQLAQLAAAGVRFADVTAPGSWTWPSHASIFTGAPPWVHGAHFPPLGVPMDGGFPPMRGDLPTLAERFAAAGYRTVSLSANCLLSPELGLVRGFQDARCLDSPGAVEQEAEAVIQADDPRPLLLFANLMPAHAPYHLVPVAWNQGHAARLSEDGAPSHLRPYLTRDAPGIDLQQREAPTAPTGIQRYLSGDLALTAEDLGLITDLYDGEIVEADMRLNRILTAWTAESPRGVVAVTSDHGEAFGERGRIDHRGSVYAPMVSVPLLIAAPGTLPAGRTVEAPVPLAPLGETLLSLAGLAPADAGLRPVIDGGAWPAPIQAAAWPDPYRAPLGAPHDRLWRLFRRGDRALVFSDHGEAELFDMAADPLMLEDIAAQHPEEVAALLSEASGAFPEASTGPTTAPSSEVRERLEALGYLER